MTNTQNYLAFDFGAESGRAMLGEFDGQRLALSEVHRFPNGPVQAPDSSGQGYHLHWDILRLWSEIKAGIGLASGKCGKNLASLGVDTWGVDYALLDRDGELLGNPYHYRDSRTDGMMEKAFALLPRRQIFETTGIQFMALNSLYQLLSMAIGNPALLEEAKTFLTIPDLFNFWLSGRAVCEFTIATTTQCYDPRKNTWAYPLLEALKIPGDIFPEIVPPGTRLASLRPLLAEELGLGPVPVIAPACHDTGSAVAAVPAKNERFAWISSGTWSIIGAETPDPVINERTLEYNLTNEGGVAGTWRFSKNVMGMWLVQQCKHTWTRQGKEFSYDDLTRLASQARPFQAVLDPNHDDFFKPGDMPARIRLYCQRTGQVPPENEGQIIRCVLESLALKYRQVLESLEQILGYRLEPVHIFGGGSRNQLLNQFTANACGRRVVAGPVEATATGNLLMQAIALGHIESLEAARRVVRNSFAPQVFEPQERLAWDDAYGRLMALQAG